MGAITILLVFLVIGVVGGNDGTVPATSDGPPTSPGTAVLAPTPLAAAPGSGADPPGAQAAAATPSTTRGGIRRWTVVGGGPSGRAITDAATFAALVVGSCLAWPDPAAVSAVPCAGPHSAEVTSSRDITADFATTPNRADIAALSARACPAARRSWTGTDLDIYIDGYVWRYEAGTPGRVLRRFLCTVALAGYSPFTGTLRDSD